MRICVGISSGSGSAAAAGAYCAPIPVVLQWIAFLIPAVICIYLSKFKPLTKAGRRFRHSR
jgi:hypothetical protein